MNEFAFKKYITKNFMNNLCLEFTRQHLLFTHTFPPHSISFSCYFMILYTFFFLLYIIKYTLSLLYDFWIHVVIVAFSRNGMMLVLFIALYSSAIKSFQPNGFVKYAKLPFCFRFTFILYQQMKS